MTLTRARNWGDTDYRVPFGYLIEARSGADVLRNVSNMSLKPADSLLNRVSALLRCVISAGHDPYDFDLERLRRERHHRGHTAGVSGRGDDLQRAAGHAMPGRWRSRVCV